MVAFAPGFASPLSSMNSFPNQVKMRLRIVTLQGREILAQLSLWINGDVSPRRETAPGRRSLPIKQKQEVFNHFGERFAEEEFGGETNQAEGEHKQN
jgi:hypothetical protein